MISLQSHTEKKNYLRLLLTKNEFMEPMGIGKLPLGIGLKEFNESDVLDLHFNYNLCKL